MEEPHKHLHEQVLKSLQKLENIIDNDENDFAAMYNSLKKVHVGCNGNDLALRDGLLFLSCNPKVKEIPPWFLERLGVSITLLDGRLLLQYINLCKFDWRFSSENLPLMIPPAINSIEQKEWLSRLKRLLKQKQRTEAYEIHVPPLASKLKGGSLPCSRRSSIDESDELVEIRPFRYLSVNSTPLPSAPGDQLLLSAAKGGDVSFADCHTMDEIMMCSSDGSIMLSSSSESPPHRGRQVPRHPSSYSRHYNSLQSSAHASLVQDLMDQANTIQASTSQESSPYMPRLRTPHQHERLHRGASESPLLVKAHQPSKSVGHTPVSSPTQIFRKQPIESHLGSSTAETKRPTQLPSISRSVDASAGHCDKMKEVVSLAVTKARNADKFRKESQMIKNEVFRVLNI